MPDTDAFPDEWYGPIGNDCHCCGRQPDEAACACRGIICGRCKRCLVHCSCNRSDND